VAALVLAMTALLALPGLASANFVYWTVPSPGNSIGRAKINGTGLNNAFIGVTEPHDVATDANFIYWTQGDATTGSIGRANLNGTGANPSFIPHSAGVNNPRGIAVTPSAIFWSNADGTIGRANLDGSSPTSNFISTPNSSCDLAADSSFVYFLNNSNIGRAPVGGGTAQATFIPIPTPFCGPAIDPNYLYWVADSGDTIGRVPVGGGTPQVNFISSATGGSGPSDVAVNSQYVFWGNFTAPAVGRANINGGSPNPTFMPGASINLNSRLTAAPSNKITVNSITKKTKKGTAAINAKVPGPGQVTLNQTSTPPDANATAAAVKQVGLSLSQASSFTLAVKPVGKTAKKLNKQVKKQLRKKHKAKATVKQTVFIHFVPAGVAGVPNTLQVTVALVKKAEKK
jgi:hypothetical protein